MSDAVCECVRDGIIGALGDETPAAHTDTRADVSLRHAAALIGVAERTLRDHLKQTANRRRYGWPIWCGSRWMFVAAAVDPMTSRQYLATLPFHEPAAIAALLPAWCERDDLPSPPGAVLALGALAERTT